MHACTCIHVWCKSAPLAILQLCFMCIRTAVDGCAVILLHRERRSVTDRLTAGRAFLSCHSSLGGGTWNKRTGLQERSSYPLKQLAALWNTLTCFTPPPPHLHHKHHHATPSPHPFFGPFRIIKSYYFSIFVMTLQCISTLDLKYDLLSVQSFPVCLSCGLLCCRSGRGFIMPKRKMEIAYSKMWRSHL